MTGTVEQTLRDIGERARAALATALMNRHTYYLGYDSREHELTVHALSDPVLAKTLITMLADVTAREWDGDPEHGATPYRTYQGRLPCRLLVNVVTDRRDVPNLLDGAVTR